jgi:uncharacterized protein YgiM (DUF1202 family)
VRAKSVNLRAAASTSARVITRLTQATAVSQIGRQGDWIQVALPGEPGRQGWVHASLVTTVPAEKSAE